MLIAMYRTYRRTALYIIEASVTVSKLIDVGLIIHSHDELLFMIYFSICYSEVYSIRLLVYMQLLKLAVIF
jgi:hypothetical protein